nr:serine hydrolase [Anaerolineae bacterium]
MKKTPSRVNRLGLLLCIVLLVALAAACGPAPGIPPQTGDGWQTADPVSVGLDAKKLNQAAARIRDGTYQNVHSLLVVKDGKLVFEEYFRGYTWRYAGDQYR